MNELKTTPAFFSKINLGSASPGPPTAGNRIRLTKNALIHEGNTQILNFPDGAVAGVTLEEVVALQVQDAGYDGSAGDAIITKIHGTTPFETWAGKSDAYVARVDSAGAPTADTLIPSEFFPEDTDRLKLTFDGTDEASQFLYLLNKMPATGFASGWNPASQTGSSGYSLIECLLPVTSLDQWSLLNPGGNDPASTFLKAGVDIFCVETNPETGKRELQLIGCTDNSAPIDLHPEFAKIPKGAGGGTWKTAMDTRPMTITGNIRSSNGWVMKNLLHSQYAGNDGVYDHFETSTDFVTIPNKEIVFSSYTMEGKVVRVWAPSATLRATGAIDPGAADAMHPFEIDCGQLADWTMTSKLYSIFRFALNQAIV